MKDKPSEWIAISDLMAGVMAVVMLLLVVSVLQKSAEEAKHNQEMEQAKAAGGSSTQAKLNNIMGELQGSLGGAINSGMVSIDGPARKITLRDGVFNSGSACVVGQAKFAFTSIQQRLLSFLNQFPDGRIYVEGHTDNAPVAMPVTDYRKNCTVYDDNYTLSAARAREARKLLTGQMSEADSKRIVVAGFGESQPLLGIPPGDARQRRIEVRLVLPEKE